ncbi:three component ABC system middle component [Paenibacillus sp. FSL F4-0122]|uniref:three component ABC system middle component n=1 Tax=Paenibacillus sp. FSL F4-0122 TaxID=2921371 RepID=UPI0030F6DE23
MNNEYLKTLSLNPYMVAKIIQSFLEGYGGGTSIKLLFYVLPIVLSKDSRTVLLTAKNTSRMETLFGTKKGKSNYEDLKLSARVNLSGFVERYVQFEELTKLAIIVLSTEKKINISNSVFLLRVDNYKNYNGNLHDLLRAAFYLGIIFKKHTTETIDLYLGVENKWKVL